MAGLLVSVRSAAEARLAADGGASVVDVKEPDRGPLGAADPDVWRAVREAVPVETPVSVALGELIDRPMPDRADFSGISFRKLGLAAAGPDWRAKWERLRLLLGPGPDWVAVAYVEGHRVGAPAPEEVLDEAIRGHCGGILVDTFDKRSPSTIDLTWADFVARAQASGLFVALAGGLDEAAIDRLLPLDPDLFAVRGAACFDGDRRAGIDPSRVLRLRRLVQPGVSVSRS